MADHGENHNLQILSAGAPRGGVLACIERYGDADVEFATAPQIAARLAAGSAGTDLVIAPPAQLEQARSDGLLSADQPVVLGAIYAGAVVNSAAAECSIDTPAALRKTLLAAHRIIFNRASSGRHIEQLLERLNITADVANRVIRTDTGAGVIEALATDSAGADIGFAQSTEIRRLAAQGVNIRLLGLVPEALVETTVYAAAVLRHSERQPAARDFLAFLTSPPARTLLEAAGLNTGALPG